MGNAVVVLAMRKRIGMKTTVGGERERELQGDKDEVHLHFVCMDPYVSSHEKTRNKSPQGHFELFSVS